MKKVSRRLFAGFLVLALLLSLPVAAFASAALGEDRASETVQIGQNTAWTRSTFWSTSSSDLRTENYVVCAPNASVKPIVAYGEAVTARAKTSAIAAELERDGYRVTAAINADFYNTANGVPLGLVVTDGVIRSGSSTYYAVGFTASGAVVTGRPALTTTLHYSSMDAVSGLSTQNTLAIQDINKDRSDKGVHLFTYDFNAKHTTGTTASGTDVILRVKSGELAIGERMTLTVESVLTGNTAAVSIAEGQLVLSANDSSPEVYRSVLQQLTVGSEVTLEVTAEDSAWNSVEYAVGSLYQLVTQGTVSASVTSLTGSAPRTAIGVKADGSVLYYTIDGRQSGYSIGATYTMVARRLIELGCVTAFAMDGGGSTTMVVSKPGQSAGVVNKPSDGYERAVSNQLLLLSAAQPTGWVSGYYMESDSSHVLAGADVTLTVSPYDSNYFPVDAAYTLSASGGSLNGDVFTTPTDGGSVVVTASGGGGRGTLTLSTVRSPDSIQVLKGASAITSLSVKCGTSTPLGAKASSGGAVLTAADRNFTWAVSGEIGTIDGEGTFLAGNRVGSGSITVTAGSKTVTLPVTVTSDTHFTDTSGTWASTYIDALFEKGVVTGYADGTFLPDASITRQQFSAMLYRALNLNDADYAGAELPFADADSLSSYAQTPVRALYALGIVNGTAVGGKTFFYPGNALTRAQAAAMIGRALGASAEGEAPFTDAASIPAYAGSYVNALVQRGVLGGFSDGSFRPQNNITRAQMAKMLYMMLS